MKEICFSDIFLIGMDTLRFVRRWIFSKYIFISKAMSLKKDDNFQRDANFQRDIQFIYFICLCINRFSNEGIYPWTVIICI